MATMDVCIAVGRPRVGGVCGRTPLEFRLLIEELKDDPGMWYVYSNHVHMGSAHTRASRLRGSHTPNVLVPYADSLEFKAFNHDEHGAVVLVRWRAGDTPS